MAPLRPAARRAAAAWRFFRRPWVFDVALVAVLALIGCAGLVSVVLAGHPQLAAGAAHYVVSTIPLLVRRRHPDHALALVAALDLMGLATGLIVGPNVPVAVALYSVGRYTRGRTAVWLTAAAVVVYNAAIMIAVDTSSVWVTNAFVFLASMGVGQFARVRAELRERDRTEAAEAAVRAERRRIARELHDVVAHHLSVINALVGGARATLPPGHDVTREALSGAEQTARQALAEMRQLLYVLRAGDGDGADAATGVGADRLPALVEEARTAGLPAELTVTGAAVPLPAAVDHAVYRIVQEALTNTRKHAPGARARILLAYERERVEVEVLDDGADGARPDGPPGFGLGGMAERVALCGGELRAGHRPEGGFRVRARIPLEIPLEQA
ncbi:sensor histidine kinase [Nonomuraea rhodomycinica]|uniref:histidine kinase n=1 Tax=Nonomuraea rhodomycinica TaxID=1712872 RepID=A0A7Y6IUS9_9ACTN|nr:histidine kinase [Nonomuraea rhodomycinica]NUW44801.1 sensor histidine kinase [Nonomuraea rhodomycinica]